MRRLFSILMLSASLFSCSELADYPMEVVLETKVMLDGGSTIWNQGAEVSVFYKSDSNEKWIYDSTSCALVGTRSKLKEEKNDSIVAVYPYCPAAELDRNLIYTELPASQPYVDGDSGACIMWAATQNDELHFRHATSIVALKITGQADIDSLVFSSSGGETVAGKVCLDMSENSPAVKPYEDGTASEIVIRSKDGSVIEVDGGLTVYVSVIPQVFSRGFKFSAMMSDGSVQDVQVSQETVLEPGKIRIMEMAVEDKFVLDLKFSDGQNRMNPFLMSLWPTTDMVTGELIGPYHLIDYPFDYPFCFYIQKVITADSFRITNGGGLRFGGTKGDYVLLPPSEGRVLSEVCVEQSSSRTMQVTDAQSEPVMGGEMRSGSAIFILKNTVEGESYRLMVQDDDYGCIYSLRLIYK